MSWNEQTDSELLDLIAEHGTKWTMLSELFSVKKTPAALRLRWQQYLCDNPRRRRPDYAEIQEPSNPIQKAIQHRKHQFNRDGSQTSERLIPESALQTPETLMKAFDYNPDMFELVNSTANYWDSNAGEGNVITLYQAKVTVKPRKQTMDWKEIGERLNEKVKPRLMQSVPFINSDRYLVINLFDLHFGNMTLTDYQTSLDKINRILNNQYKEVLIISGGDLLNENDFRGQTAKGTNIGATDMEQAWEDAFDFLDMVIHAATQNATTVNVLYVPGNHDEYSGSTVLKAIRRIYERQPNVYVDCEQQTFKATLLGHNFIGATHGDKANKKRYPQIFATMFSQLWGAEGVYTREMFSGHLHNEHVLDDGLLMRQMPTRNHLDEYHKQNGFVTAHRRLQLVEYSEYETEVIYYA
ncbi:hypothetical protein G7058_00155 [Jeotgalibaca porci]|uniref:Uncharacterized protein n=1 Tax=Jeotgalibaca porci TaxID=1868793 RepID=A0A6G7WE84_9LACT|nr:Myb-like DNA-binding domain-containing protein [Jeotgalibaca porci]QIK50610.1 hypothetical protein G7058_00155 [Jeotgalibaca porci]